MGLTAAVVGGGIFGVTSAVYLARCGYLVTLYEQSDDILQAASGINQYRLHRGYHYPRSPETVASARDSHESFRGEYGSAVIDENRHYYAISARDSMVSADRYLEFMDEAGLEYELDRPGIVRAEAVDLCVSVRESLFDPAELKRLCWQKLHREGVRVHLNTRADTRLIENFDFRVIATYGELNRLAHDEPGTQRPYQFEICEKPVVRLPDVYAGRSVVVMDGPFMCVDPLGRTGLFVMGNVVHAIHHRNVGGSPEVPTELKGLLNSGIVKGPAVSNFASMLSSAKEFFAGLEEAEHVGSMFTVRTVLPYMDDTDARPTLVRRLDDRTVTVFSGKITTCVVAAQEVASLGARLSSRAGSSAGARA